MARKLSPSPDPAATPVPVSVTLTISQQALNVALQTIRAIGWVKDLEDLSIGTDLLKVLPRPDPTDWVKTEAEVLAMDAGHRAAYLVQDKAWTTKLFTFTVTPAQRVVAAKAIAHWANEAIKAQKLAPADWLEELLVAFEVPIKAKES